MEYEAVRALSDRHPAWRLLRAHNAPLVLSFLGRRFVDANAGGTPAAVLVADLDDELLARNAGAPDEPAYPRPPAEYLDDWSAPESGWLRRYYPPGSDEVHYDATPAFERAYAWVAGLRARAFVGTESRLHTVVDLLRQIATGVESDPQVRLEELRRRRAEIDAQIAEVEAGRVQVLSDTGLRDRYQQLSSTARELLSDFREVEENFRGLDRAAREQIAAWQGSKGELLADLVEGRASINDSDQGASFRAFHDFLLSSSRQAELTDLLARVQQIEALDEDDRLRTIRHDWSEAAERTQATVRQISEQLRRFLDDQVWLENRRVLELVRTIEAAALSGRETRPTVGLELDVPGVEIALPFERPLYDASPAAAVESMLQPGGADDIDTSALFTQTFVDHTRLADNIRAVLPRQASTTLADIVALYPLEQGLAELIGYLALSEGDLEVTLDESEESLLTYLTLDGAPRRARLPQVTVRRR